MNQNFAWTFVQKEPFQSPLIELLTMLWCEPENIEEYQMS